MRLIHTLSKLFAILTIITSTTYASDFFDYGNKCQQQPNVKTITNLRTGEKIISISDPKHEQGAARLVQQYGSNGNFNPFQSNRLRTTNLLVAVPMQDIHYNKSKASMRDSQSVLLYPYQGFPQVESQSTPQENNPLLATAVLDVEGNTHHHGSIGGGCTASLARIFNSLCCMNTLKIVSFSVVVVVCLFAGFSILWA